MKLNKSFIGAVMVASFLTSSAFAKTEGSYAGINLLKSKITFQQNAVYNSFGHTNNPTIANFESPKRSNNKYGLGLSYKYAFSYNGFFAAPGVTYDYYNNNSARHYNYADGDDLKAQVKNRYAIKSDFGYDITDKIAPYFTVGYSLVSASAQSSIDDETANKSSFVGDWFYGAGLKFDVTNQIALNLEYNTQKFKVKAGVPFNPSAEYTANDRIKLETIKAGISYKF